MGDVARSLLEEIQVEFGGHIERRHLSGRHRRWSDAVSLGWVKTDELIEILKALIPHLSVKAEQAKLSLWWMENCASIRSDTNRNIDKAREIFDEESKAMKKDMRRLSKDAETRISACLAVPHPRRWSKD